MSEFFFVVKIFLATIAIVFLMQVRIGRATVEQHSIAWLHTSTAVEALRGVADGAVAAALNGIDWGKNLYQRKFGSGERAAYDRHASKKYWETEASRHNGDEID